MLSLRSIGETSTSLGMTVRNLEVMKDQHLIAGTQHEWPFDSKYRLSYESGGMATTFRQGPQYSEQLA